jgi:hypothetical protein
MPLPSKEAIEKAIEKEENEGIMKLNKGKIKQEKNDILQKLQLPREILKEYHDTLKNYRYIEKLDDILLGNYIRWINLSDPNNLYLTKGAIVSDFRETSDTIHIVCKTQFGRFFNVDLNKCIIFQKLNNQEEILLAVINYLEK